MGPKGQKDISDTRERKTKGFAQGKKVFSRRSFVPTANPFRPFCALSLGRSLLESLSPLIKLVLVLFYYL